LPAKERIRRRQAFSGQEENKDKNKISPILCVSCVLLWQEFGFSWLAGVFFVFHASAMIWRHPVQFGAIWCNLVQFGVAGCSWQGCDCTTKKADCTDGMRTGLRKDLNTSAAANAMADKRAQRRSDAKRILPT
jgi:hypothetical protein